MSPIGWVAGQTGGFCPKFLLKRLSALILDELKCLANFLLIVKGCATVDARGCVIILHSAIVFREEYRRTY